MVKEDQFEHVNAAIQSTENHIDALHQRAYSLVERHWEWVRHMESRQTGLNSASQLAARCQRKEGSNAIGLTWSKMKRVRSTSQKKGDTLYTHLPRPAGSFGYSLSVLRKLARDWEADAVEALELQLAEIRRESSHCNKAIASLRYALGNGRRGADRSAPETASH